MIQLIVQGETLQECVDRVVAGMVDVTPPQPAPEIPQPVRDQFEMEDTLEKVSNGLDTLAHDLEYLTEWVKENSPRDPWTIPPSVTDAIQRLALKLSELLQIV